MAIPEQCEVAISFLPQWIIDISSISSIFGLVVTIFLFIEARNIHNSFLRRARLPEITKDLAKETSDLCKTMANWSTDNKPALEILAKIKGLLEYIKPKVPSEEKKKINNLLKNFYPKKHMIFNSNLSDISENSAWDIYRDLNTIITSLQQLIKDSKWD